MWTHQEVVARSRTLDELSFEASPTNPFITNFDTPRSYLQKQGHGALVDTPSGEWYYASLCGRPWHHETESFTPTRAAGARSDARPRSRRSNGTEDGWPYVVGGHGGERLRRRAEGRRRDPLPRRTTTSTTSSTPDTLGHGLEYAARAVRREDGFGRRRQPEADRTGVAVQHLRPVAGGPSLAGVRLRRRDLCDVRSEGPTRRWPV